MWHQLFFPHLTRKPTSCPSLRHSSQTMKQTLRLLKGYLPKYKQDTEGEVVALLKLPADIIGSYFTGIGNLFSSFKTKDEGEADALAESLKLELAKKKYDACILAIKAKDDAMIKALGCE